MLFGCLRELRIEVFTHRFLDRKEKIIGSLNTKEKSNQVPGAARRCQREEQHGTSSRSAVHERLIVPGQGVEETARKPSYQTPELLEISVGMGVFGLNRATKPKIRF
jgi:hypothetical protein